jgi:hypothetical protein
MASRRSVPGGSASLQASAPTAPTAIIASNARARASANTTNSAPAAKSAGERASANTICGAPAAKSAEARASANTICSAPAAKSAGERASANTICSAPAAESAGERASANTICGDPAAESARTWCPDRLRRSRWPSRLQAATGSPKLTKTPARRAILDSSCCAAHALSKKKKGIHSLCWNVGMFYCCGAGLGAARRAQEPLRNMKRKSASRSAQRGARRSSAGRPRGEVGAKGPAKHAHWGGGMWPERLEFLGDWHCG